MFHPFEMNDTNRTLPICEIDTDVHFYYSIKPYLPNVMITMNMALLRSNPKWLIQININFLPHNHEYHQQNLSDVIAQLNCWSLELCIIESSKTWIKDDICDLFIIEYCELLATSLTQTWRWHWVICSCKMESVRHNELRSFDDCIEFVSIEISRLVFCSKRKLFVLWCIWSTYYR